MTLKIQVLERPSGDDYLHVDYLRELQAIKRVDFGQFIHRFNRSFARTLGCITCIDFHGVDCCKTNACGYIRRSIQLLYCIFNIHLLVSAMMQYSHDFDILRLQRLTELNKTGSSSSSSSSSDEMFRLKFQIEQRKEQLNFIGAPYSYLNIIIECIYIYTILLAFLIFLVPRLFYGFVRPFDLQVVRDQLDFEAESANTGRMIDSKVGEFLESSRVYSSEFGARLFESSRGRERRRAKLLSFQLPAKQIDCTGEQLMELREMRALLPYNKSLKWFQKRSSIVFQIQFYFLLYSSTFMLTTIVASWLVSLNHQRGLGELAIHISLISLVTLIALSACLLDTYLIIACLDQIVYVKRLYKLIGDCIMLNNQLYGTQQEVAHKMNTNLLFVMMQYKIFVAQHKPTLKTVEFAIVFVASIVLIIPAVIKLHIPYFDLFKIPNIRQFAFFMSIATLMPANIIIVPLCYTHSRCVDLYRVMSSLLAHVTEIESYKSNYNYYDIHLIIMLRKELKHPQQFIDQFKPKLAGMAGTYSTLLKLHFWCGLLVISIAFDSQTDSGSFETLFKDPLGVFKTL